MFGRTEAIRNEQTVAPANMTSGDIYKEINMLQRLITSCKYCKYFAAQSYFIEFRDKNNHITIMNKNILLMIMGKYTIIILFLVLTTLRAYVIIADYIVGLCD